jgi:hypothetical protein
MQSVIVYLVSTIATSSTSLAGATKLNIEAIAKLETGTSRSHVERDRPGAFDYGATMRRFVLPAGRREAGWNSQIVWHRRMLTSGQRTIESVTGQKPSSRLSLWHPKVKNMSYRKRLGSRFLPVVLEVEPSRL